MKINDITNENSGVKRVNTGIDMKAELAKRAAQISSPGTNPTISSRTNVTRNSNSGTGTTHKTFSKYTQKMGDLGGTSVSKVNNITKSANGATGTSTKRFVRPGGSGTQTVTDVGTGQTTRTDFQLKGPQSWAYDKPKLNASKKINERITRPGDDEDPSLWQRIKNIFTSNSLGSDDRKSRRNELDDIETRRAQKIRNRNKVDKRIRKDNAEKQDQVNRELLKRRKKRWDYEDYIADMIAQDQFGKNAYELDDLDRANILRTAAYVVDDVRRFGKKVLDDPNYKSDFRKKYPQGLIPAVGKKLDGTDAEPDYSYLNPKKRFDNQNKFSHPAFTYRFDDPQYHLDKDSTSDGYATAKHVQHDLDIDYEPRSTIYRSNTHNANIERDERIATGKANIKNIEIQNKINKATGNTTDTTTDNTQKKFARDIQNEDGVIVPGVNTTVDVKPGQTEKEAAKFFGKGKPAELHKKARKNSNAHNLYNLGLVSENKKKDDKPSDIEGFDPQTSMDIKKLKAKYPHADNIMSALMAQTSQTLQNQYKGDKRRDEQDKKQVEQDKKHNTRFRELEQRIWNIVMKNNLKEGKK